MAIATDIDIDWKLLSFAFARFREARSGDSLRQLEKEVGVSAAQLSRLGQDSSKTLSPKNLARVSAWMGLDLKTFVMHEGDEQDSARRRRYVERLTDPARLRSHDRMTARAEHRRAARRA